MIFDFSGRNISTVFNEYLHPGTYVVNFNSSNIPSGIYFYTLSFGKYKCS